MFDKADAKSVSRLRWIPVFLVFALAAALTLRPFWPVWFWYHPSSMLCGYSVLMGSATLVKKLGGREATKLHGFLMGTGTASAAFGWYVIHSNKEAMGKPHITTWHGLGGLIVLVGSFLLTVQGVVALHPDWGVLKTKKLVRALHKFSGRAIILFSSVVSVLGWNTMKGGDFWSVALFAVPLVVFAFVLM